MSTPSRPDLVLVADTLRSHRWGVLSWVGGAFVAMYVIALGFVSEVSRFPGGARAMAAGLEAAAQAMRPLRWPADRLDTLGGYLTFHNVTLFVFALSLYAAVQGAHALRATDVTGMLEEILATGRSRARVVADRAAGFAATLALIGLGLALALVVATVAGDQPDLSGSFGIALAGVLCAGAAWGLGLLVAQLMGSARSATAWATGALSVLYVVSNVSDQLGPLGVLRFVSPFYYYTRSRALVPGHGVDVVALVALVAVTGVLLAAAAWAFDRRDVPTGLWARQRRAVPRPVPVQRPALRTMWTAVLLRQRIGLMVWSLAAAFTLALMGYLEPAVVDVWGQFDMAAAILGNRPGVSADQQYLSFAAQLVLPILTAYVITQANGWVGDLRHGRVELVLAAPMSWRALVVHRLLALTAGSIVITVSGIAGLVAGSLAVGLAPEPLGLVRVTADVVLFTVALAAVAALVVAWLGSGGVSALAAFTAGSYLLVYLVPLFAWPDWVMRLSVFGAAGDPYLAMPPFGGLVFLLALAGLGGLAATVIAQRAAKTA